MSDVEIYQRFIEKHLMPQALQSLKRFYSHYCQGGNIDIQTKEDDSPASDADRETEKFLREKIKDAFPEHGIWGEEFGCYNVNHDYVWILDPLDGTQQFLAKKDNYFGCLIGLTYKGKPLLGYVGDPLIGKIWLNKPRKNKTIEIKNSVLSCTNPQGMFKTQKDQNFIAAVMDEVKETKIGLNCIGFANVINGTIDLVIESDLKIHDIVPLVPLLQSCGAIITDFAGNDYRQKIFDIESDSNKKFDIIVTPHQNILNEVLLIYKNREAV